MASKTISASLPSLPGDWSGDKDFKSLGHLSSATNRTVEPVGPHFLAHARRKRHKRTFSEDDRIQAQENVKKVEDDDAGEISEPEDQMMLQRDAKDWKVCVHNRSCCLRKLSLTNHTTDSRSLRRPWSQQIPLQGD